MEPNDLERAVRLGARLTRAFVGLGVDLALAPARLVLRAVSPPPPTPPPAAWQPPPQPAPPVPAPPQPAPPPPPVVPLREEPTEPPEPPADVLASNDLSAAEAARMREAAREAQTDEDSPGPELRVAEPWDGYAGMNVDQVLERLIGADQTTRAIVRLYEETHRNRKGILRATE